jgi:NADPH:quinone reductase-like Zn-dependent oxidoreductase
MLTIKSVAVLLVTLLLMSCSSEQHATLFQAGEKQITVTIDAKTGHRLNASFKQVLPSGTSVTILDNSSSESFVKVRIDTGQFKGQGATVDRNSIRRAE